MIFKIIDSLLGRKKQQVLPEYTCSLSLATMINTFFVEKIDSIRAEFPLLEPTLQPYSFTDIDSIMLNPIRSGGGALKAPPLRFFALTHLILELHYCALVTFPKK